MPSPVVAGLGRRRKRWVRERADGNDDQVRLGGLGVEDLRAAGRAEMKDVLLLVRLVGDPGVVVEVADDPHLVGSERRLHPERASGPALAGEAVADGHHPRVTVDLQAKLPTKAGGLSCSHREDPTQRLGSSCAARIRQSADAVRRGAVRVRGRRAGGRAARLRGGSLSAERGRRRRRARGLRRTGARRGPEPEGRARGGGLGARPCPQVDRVRLVSRPGAARPGLVGGRGGIRSG